MRCLFAACVLISAMCGDEFVRTDLPLAKPFGSFYRSSVPTNAPTASARFSAPQASLPKIQQIQPARRPAAIQSDRAAKSMPTDRAFEDLARIYANKPIEFERLKAVTLAMMMLESGRGSSDLARIHNNFGGLKYRPEMANRARKIRYNASDGYDYYCEFGSIEEFIGGFWAFLDRKPYAGWRKKTYSERAFLEHIAPIYCPFNKNYVESVMKLVPEAQALLDQSADEGVRIAMAKETAKPFTSPAF